MNDTDLVVRRALHCPHGWAISHRRSGHRRLTLPDGRFVTLGCTPSDRRTRHNLARDIRRLCGCKLV